MTLPRVSPTRRALRGKDATVTARRAYVAAYTARVRAEQGGAVATTRPRERPSPTLEAAYLREVVRPLVDAIEAVSTAYGDGDGPSLPLAEAIYAACSVADDACRLTGLVNPFAPTAGDEPTDPPAPARCFACDAALPAGATFGDLCAACHADAALRTV